MRKSVVRKASTKQATQDPLRMENSRNSGNLKEINFRTGVSPIYVISNNWKTLYYEQVDNTRFFNCNCLIFSSL